MNDGVQLLPTLTDGKRVGGGGVRPRDTDDSSRGERVLLFCVKAWCRRPGPCLCIVQGRGEGRVLEAGMRVAIRKAAAGNAAAGLCMWSHEGRGNRHHIDRETLAWSLVWVVGGWPGENEAL